MADKIPLGARVKVQGYPNGCGNVGYVGVHLSDPTRQVVGCILDDAEGKNNGSVRGETYFHCAPNHGVLVHHSKVQIIGAEASRTPSSPARPDSAVSNTIVNPTKYAAAARQRQTSGGADYAEVDGVTKQVQDNALAVGSLRKQLGVEQQEVASLKEELQTLTSANTGMAAEMTALKDRFELEMAAMQIQVATLTAAVARCAAVLTDDAGSKVDSLDGLRAAMGMHVDYVEMSPLETAVDGEQDRAEDSADEVAGFDEDL